MELRVVRRWSSGLLEALTMGGVAGMPGEWGMVRGCSRMLPKNVLSGNMAMQVRDVCM